MKLMHVADLHFGKNLNGINLAESGDQKAWSEKFLAVVDSEKPDAILIAGDIYDRSAPSDEAVDLVDWFFTELVQRHVNVFIVSGNHDSGHKLAFMSNIVSDNDLYIAGRIEEEMKHVTLEDQYGEVTFWLMPYIFPAAFEGVKGFDVRPKTYDEAAKMYIAAQNIDFSKRNVIIAHQLVTTNGYDKAMMGGSETIIGGVGNIFADTFKNFDYVALGHIHKAQTVGKDTIRYSGSPLCYHFDETKYPNKGPVVIELGDKGTEPEIHVDLIPPLHEMVEIPGKYSEIMRANTTGIYKYTDNDGSLKQVDINNKYFKIVLKDEKIEANMFSDLSEMLEAHGSKLLERDSVKYRSISNSSDTHYDQAPKTLDELFRAFYYYQKNSDPTDTELAIIDKLTEIIENSKADDISKANEKETDELVNFLLDMEDNQ